MQKEESTPAFLRIRDLRKHLGSQEVLRGVNLEIQTGQTMVIIGRSGGGKSVLLKHLIGLLHPDKGEIFVEGESIGGLGERQLGPIRRKVGILFQHGALFDSMSVEENVAFPLRESGERDPKAIAARVAEALEVVDLAGQQKKMPVNLSGGMKKRVALARAVVSRPRCILYDEPTAGLDPVVSDSINLLIRRLQKRFAVTSLVVTHDMKSAFDIADRIAYLKHGRIYFEGTAAELQASADPDIQDFIAGRSRANLDDEGDAIFDRITMASSSSESRTLEFRVGLFMLFGLAIIGYMVVTVGRFSTGFVKYYPLTVELPNASGLLRNSKVLLAGATIGTAGSPEVLPDGQGGPRAGLDRRAGQDLAQRADRLVGSSGLMGDRFVDVLMPSVPEGGVFGPGEVVKGSRASGMDDLEAEGGKLVGDLRATVANLNGTITRVNTELLTPAMFQGLHDSVANLSATTKNFQAASEKLNGVLDDARGTVAQAKGAMDGATATMTSAENGGGRRAEGHR